MLGFIIIIHVLISMVILNLDLGATDLGIYLSSTLNSVIPSILPTAAITQTPESSALVLAFSWVMSIVSAVVCFFSLRRSLPLNSIG